MKGSRGFVIFLFGTKFLQVNNLRFDAFCIELLTLVVLLNCNINFIETNAKKIV